MKDEDKTRQELLDELSELRSKLHRGSSDQRTSDNGGTKTNMPLITGERRSGGIFAGLPDILFIFDRDARFIDCRTNNPKDLLMPPDAFLGKHCREVLPPELAGITERTVQEVIRSREPRTYFYSLTIHGEQRVHEARMAPIGESRVLAVVRDMTELKRTQEALVRSEEKYRDLFENASDAIFLVDDQQVYADANKKAFELTGYSREELVGRSIFEFIPENQKPRSRDEFGKLKRSGKYESFRGKMRTRQGQWLDIEVSSSAIVEGGKYLGSRDIVRNVTDQVRAESELKDSEARLREAQRISHVGDWEWNIATNEVFWSDELFRIYGYEPRSIQPDYALVVNRMHPDSRDIFLAAIDAALKGEQPFEMDYLFFRADGSEAVLHTIGTVFRGPEGKPERMVGIVQDITQQKRAEAALRESEERFRSFFQTVHDGILIVDTENRTFIEANNTICSMLGYTRQELMSRSIADIHPAEELPRVNELVQNHLAGELTVDQDVPVKRKDGTVFYADISVGLLTLGNRACMIGVFRDVAERKQVEDALKMTNTRLRTLIETIPDMVFFKDTRGRHLIVNRAVESASGHSREGFIGKMVEELLPPELAASCRANDEQAMQRAEPIRSEEQVPGPDGTTRYIEMLRTPMVDDSKSVVGLVAVGRDITGRKRAEEELRKANQAYKALSACSKIIIQAADETRLLDEAVGIVLDDCGYRMVWIGLVVHDDAKSVLPVAQRGFEEGYLGTLQVTWADTERGRGPTGTAIRTGKAVVSRNILTDPTYAPWREEARKRGYASSASVPIRMGEGVLGTLNVYAATTDAFTADEIQLLQELADNLAYGLIAIRTKEEHDRAAAALRNSEQFIRNILDTVDEGFIVVDREFRIITANKAYCDQNGQRDSGHIAGRHCYEISHRLAAPCCETGETCAVMNVFRTGEPQTAVHRHTDGKGALLYVETKAFPIRDESGEIVSAIETVSNITERHLLEEERLKSQKLEAIGSLAGGIAHDFNNLLQGIFGYISMAKMTIDRKERSLAMLEQAEHALQLSVNLTKQLLTFSRGGKPVKKVISLSPVIENSVKFALSGSRASYRLILDADLLPVEADEGQIGQVIQNIALNADQAMPLGGTIVINARNLPAAKKKNSPASAGATYVEITVQDSGIGIAEPYLQRIFDPYFTTKEKGSGLGLATSYSIIRNHGGTIDVESEPGKGSTFYIYLPAAKQDAPLVQSAPPMPAARKGRVLVMDDEELIRNVLREQIKAHGHEVAVAENGDQVLEKFQDARAARRPFDVVILDLTVRGGKGGKETIVRLLEIDPSVKAVVSSGYSEDSVVADYRKHGFAACLAKPYDLRELQDTLNALLPGPGANSPSPAVCGHD